MIDIYPKCIQIAPLSRGVPRLSFYRYERECLPSYQQDDYMGLSNFSPKEFIYSKGNEPEPGTKWHGWIAGDEPAISSTLALAMWETLTEAEQNFVSPFVEWNPPKKYLTEKGITTAVRNIEKDMNIFFRKLQGLTLRLQQLSHPYDLNCVYHDDDELNTNSIKTMAAYSILCHDFAITGLLENRANMAALGYAYAVIALNVCREKKNQLLPNSDLHKTVRTQLARDNANRFHDKETRVKAAKVANYWKANIDPTLSIDKATEALQDHFDMPFTTLRKYVTAAKRQAKQERLKPANTR